MRIGLLATCIWEVAPKDEEMARKLLIEQPSNVILDYFTDAQHGSGDLSKPVMEAEELED